MIGQRALLIAIFLPLLLVAAYIGGWWYAAVVALALGLAAFEFAGMFRAGGSRPATILVVGAAVGLALARQHAQFDHTPLALSLLLLLAMAWHLVDYERGGSRPGSDFGLTVSGGLYLGWLGSYLISIRQLPLGFGWTILALGAGWIGDISAYLIGSAIGRRSMTPRLSPGKTWEGYIAGVIGGAAAGWLIPIVLASLQITDGISSALGLGVGAVIAVLTPLGDLGVSMMKRELGVKDTGRLLRAHGGVFDRIDSVVWAGVIGYYAVLGLTS